MGGDNLVPRTFDTRSCAEDQEPSHQIPQLRRCESIMPQKSAIFDFLSLKKANTKIDLYKRQRKSLIFFTEIVSIANYCL